MRKKGIILTIFLLLFSTLSVFSSSQNCVCNCFTIIAGKNTTVDGSVLLAHNEDDGGNQFLQIMRVFPRKLLFPTFAFLKNGKKIEVSSQTQELIWFEMPELYFADSFLNESGVVIVSNGCASKENAHEEGEISYMLRMLVAERARSAREAVLLLGEFVEKYGYDSLGRTYSIADSNEGWMVAVVKGHHWVAERVDDDKVAIIPNHYNIHKIDLNNTKKFLGSKDIISFAIKRGLYNPKKDGEFDFAKVYAENLKNTYNTYRQWSALRLIGGNKFKVDDIYPFEIKPIKKLSPKDLMRVLRDHFEGTKYDLSKKKGGPNTPTTYENKRPICVHTTRYSIVAQLRNNLPKPISSLLWLSIGKPDTSLFIPLYFGIKNFPADFSFKKPPYDYESIVKSHFSPVKSYFSKNKLIYTRVNQMERFVEKDYYKRIKVLKRIFGNFEEELLNFQSQFEKTFLSLYKQNKKSALFFLDTYFKGVYMNFKEKIENAEKAFIKSSN